MPAKTRGTTRWADCYTNSGMAALRQIPATWPGQIPLVAILFFAATAAAQEQKSPGLSVQDLVRVTVANEIAAANQSGQRHMFYSRKQTPKGSQTHMYVETNQAMAGALIAINDKPLTPDQQKAECDRLDGLIDNPEMLRKKAAREKEDSDRSLRIVKALPDAFYYQYAGTEQSRPGLGKAGDDLVRLTFKPNPTYNPPTHAEQVLTGMSGELLIDKDAHRLARIDGVLFREVSFGWGILGHLNKGGRFRVQQADLDLGDGAWEITEMHLNMNGKILMFKPFSMVSDEVLSDFRRVPDNLSFADGVTILKAEEERLAHNNHTPEPTEARKEQNN